jgi:hypothetical protein
MMCCDLYGKTAECVQKEIEGKEFDVCERCWRPLAERLRGKGRAKETFEQLNLEEFEEYEETLI